MSGKYTLSYECNKEKKVTVEFDTNSLESVVDNFKDFIKAVGFTDKNVNDIRYGDDDICIIKDRIKSAIELLESMNIKHNNYYDLLKYLNEAYDV